MCEISLQFKVRIVCVTETRLCFQQTLASALKSCVCLNTHAQCRYYRLITHTHTELNSEYDPQCLPKKNPKQIHKPCQILTKCISQHWQDRTSCTFMRLSFFSELYQHAHLFYLLVKTCICFRITWWHQILSWVICNLKQIPFAVWFVYSSDYVLLRYG